MNNLTTGAPLYVNRANARANPSVSDEEIVKQLREIHGGKVITSLVAITVAAFDAHGELFVYSSKATGVQTWVIRRYNERLKRNEYIRECRRPDGSVTTNTERTIGKIKANIVVGHYYGA